MKKKIEKYKFEKVLDKEYEIDIPEVPEYYFQTGIRRAIAIIPIWTSWNVEHNQKPEEIYALKFICVYGSFENKLESTQIAISDIIRNSQALENRDSLTFLLAHRADYSKRTKEQFMADLEGGINKLKEEL